MQTLEICVRDSVNVSDIFGEVSVAIRRWAETFIHLSEAEEDEEVEVVEEEQEDNKSPPDLSVKVRDKVNTRDIFGRK